MLLLFCIANTIHTQDSILFNQKLILKYSLKTLTLPGLQNPNILGKDQRHSFNMSEQFW